MLKSELRKVYINKRKSLDVDGRSALDDAIFTNFQTLACMSPTCVHCYLPIESNVEPDTFQIINWLRQTFPQVEIVISKSDLESGTLRNYLYNTDTTLKNNEWGIPEPVDAIEIENIQIDLVIVPLLIFDKKGNRLGYGKGFYDRFLSSCRYDVFKVGLSYFDAVDKITDIDHFDVPLDRCVTPYQVYQFD